MLGLTEPRDKDVSESSRNGGNFLSFHDSQQNPLQPGEYSVGQKMARPVARSQSRSDLDIVWEDDNTSFSSQTQADFSYLSTRLVQVVQQLEGKLSRNATVLNCCMNSNVAKNWPSTVVTPIWNPSSIATFKSVSFVRHRWFWLNAPPRSILNRDDLESYFTAMIWYRGMIFRVGKIWECRMNWMNIIT